MTKDDTVLSHRSFVLQAFSAPVSVFYSVLIEMLALRAIPGARVSRVFLPEGGLFSAKREYVRVRRGAEVFDICAASAGESFIVTHWLRRIPRYCAWIKWLACIFLALPFVQFVSESLNEKITGCCAMALIHFLFLAAFGWFLGLIPGVGLLFRLTRAFFGWGWKLLRLPTLFQSDTAALFRSAVPAIVEEAIQAVQSGQSLIGTADLQALVPVTSE